MLQFHLTKESPNGLNLPIQRRIQSITWLIKINQAKFIYIEKRKKKEKEKRDENLSSIEKNEFCFTSGKVMHIEWKIKSNF